MSKEALYGKHIITYQKILTKKLKLVLGNIENTLNTMAIQSGKSNLWKIMGQINFNKYIAGEREDRENHRLKETYLKDM